MRLTVKNLGVISKAEVDLSKDLILLTGENNTGKTYLAYLVYQLYNLHPEYYSPFEIHGYLSTDNSGDGKYKIDIYKEI